mmetsp:Transcript_1575/g.6291  ORF Transcript_1575/g.6291 Transcript_1575/m.6291 type:complete len:693 (-) Transcript_1575:452-2530(-)
MAASMALITTSVAAVSLSTSNPSAARTTKGLCALESSSARASDTSSAPALASTSSAPATGPQPASCWAMMSASSKPDRAWAVARRAISPFRRCSPSTIPSLSPAAPNNSVARTAVGPARRRPIASPLAASTHGSESTIKDPMRAKAARISAAPTAAAVAGSASAVGKRGSRSSSITCSRPCSMSAACTAAAAASLYVLSLSEPTSCLTASGRSTSADRHGHCTASAGSGKPSRSAAAAAASPTALPPAARRHAATAARGGAATVHKAARTKGVPWLTIKDTTRSAAAATAGDGDSAHAARTSATNGPLVPPTAGHLADNSAAVASPRSGHSDAVPSAARPSASSTLSITTRTATGSGAPARAVLDARPTPPEGVSPEPTSAPGEGRAAGGERPGLAAGAGGAARPSGPGLRGSAAMLALSPAADGSSAPSAARATKRGSTWPKNEAGTAPSTWSAKRTTRVALSTGGATPSWRVSLASAWKNSRQATTSESSVHAAMAASSLPSPRGSLSAKDARAAMTRATSPGLSPACFPTGSRDAGSPAAGGPLVAASGPEVSAAADSHCRPRHSQKATEGIRTRAASSAALRASVPVGPLNLAWAITARTMTPSRDPIWPGRLAAPGSAAASRQDARAGEEDAQRHSLSTRCITWRTEDLRDRVVIADSPRPVSKNTAMRLSTGLRTLPTASMLAGSG